MTPILYALHSVSAAASDFLVASIWQGLVVAACVALLLRSLPGLTAAVRSMIWTAVLLLVVLFPGLSLVLHGSVASASTHTELLHASDRWSLALLMVWVAFSLLRASQLIGSAIRLQRLARRAIVVAPSESVATLLRGSRRRVELCSSMEVDRPSVAGFFHPRILLAPELLARLSVGELEQVVLHEMEHLRRYDDWTNLLQKLSLVLVPLHPVLMWLDRKMCLERELACDDGVLRQTRARKAYAACLARLAEDSIVRRGFSLALGALGSQGGNRGGSRERGSELTGRVHRILSAPEKRMSRGKIWFATSVLLTAACVGAAGLARGPQLIGFDPAGMPLAARQAVSSSSNRFEAVSFRPSATYRPFKAQPMLVKAVTPERRPFAMLPAVERSRTHRTRVVRAMQRNLASSRARVVLTAWRPIVPPAHWTMTIAEDPQFLYAAVPTADGWLIIQL